MAKTLRATIMAVNPKNKESTVKDDYCDSTKDPPTVKSVFSLGYKERE